MNTIDETAPAKSAYSIKSTTRPFAFDVYYLMHNGLPPTTRIVACSSDGSPS